MKTLRFSTVLFAIGTACAAFGGNYYVATQNPAANDDNPGTQALPFKTIQAAVDAAAKTDSGYDFDAGDTIWVGPGDYDEGGYVDSYQTNRVCITCKCRIFSTDGKDKTAIVGHRDPATGGLGSGSVRCVLVPKAGQGSILKGFTIRNGSTRTSGAGGYSHHGGGICVEEYSKKFYVADSTIRDCYAYYGGGMFSGTAIRCLFENNDISNYSGSAGESSAFWHCVFFESGLDTNGAYLDACVMVNCTTYNCNGYNGTKNENRDYGGKTAKTYNSLVINGSGVADKIYGLVTNSVTTTTEGSSYYQVVSPMLRDFRLLSTSVAIGAASSNHLTCVAFPSELGWTDFNGKALPNTESLNCGAVQEVVTPAAGRIYLTSPYNRDDATKKVFRIVVDGHTNKLSSYIYGVTFPTNYTYKPVPRARNTVNETLNSCGNYGPYFDWCNELMLTPPVAGSALVYKETQMAGTTYWVSAGADGSDDNDGLSSDTPFKTLAKAAETINANSKWCVVLVKPGVYDSGTVGNYRFKITANALVNVRSTEGPDKTFVVGGDGIGGFGFPSYMGGVSGITITGCRNQPAVSYVQPLSYIIDCTISNNTSTGTIISGGRLQRTRIIRNETTGTTGYIWNGSFACGTLFESNTNNHKYALFSGDTFYHCTIAGQNKGGFLFRASKFANSVVTGPGTYDNVNGALSSAPGSYMYGLDVGTVILSGVSTADPMLLSSGVPMGISPILCGGAYGTDDAMTNNLYRIQSCGGTDWANYTIGSDGRMTAGAYQATVAAAAILEEPANGGLAVSGANWGENVVADGSSLTFTLKPVHTGTRRCKGLDVNGTFVDFADYPDGWTYTVSSGATSVKVKAVYDTRIYAAPNGDPTADGLTADTPTTLKNAATKAVSGETVILLPGIYDGETVSYGSEVTSNRVILAKGVNIASQSGKPEDTIIRGAPGIGGIYSNGCVRCMTIGGENVISNITLCGGYSYCLAPIQVSGTREYDAVFHKLGGTRADTFAIGCIISNCHSSVRTVCEDMTLINCRIIDCAPGWYDMTKKSNLYGCLVHACPGAYPLDAPYEVVNCTVGPHGSIWGSLASCGDSNAKIYNTLFLDGGGQSSSVKDATFYRSYFGKCNPPDSDKANWYDGSQTNAQITAMVLTKDFTPVKGQCDALDAGNNDYSALYPARFAEYAKIDVYGNPRVLNGAIDVGAVEYDWRGDFTADLNAKHMSVTDATAGVIETADKTVKLADGDALTLAPTDAKGARYGRQFPITVSGGTLTVSVNGTAVATFSANGMWRYADGSADDKIVFSFDETADGGYAELAATQGNCGLVIVVK